MAYWPQDFLYDENERPNSGSTLPAFRPEFNRRNLTFSGRLRSSIEQLIDDVTFKHGVDYVPYTHTGSVIHIKSGSLAKVHVSGSTSFSGIRGDRRTHYAIGQEVNHSMVCRVETDGNTHHRWGMFDDEQGFFFEQSGSDINIVKRSSATGQTLETKVSQSDWSVDKMDGSGRSEFVLDTGAFNIFTISMQGNCVGRTTFWVNDLPVHVYDSRGGNVGSIVGSGDLAAGFESLGPGSGSLFVAGSSVRVENGGGEINWRTNSFATVLMSASVGNTETHLISIRPSLTSSSGVKNTSLILPTDVELSPSSTTLYRIYIGTETPTGPGKAWKPVQGWSLSEKFLTGTFNASGSRLIAAGIASANETGHLHGDFERIFKINGEALSIKPYTNERQMLTITGQKTSGGTTTVTALTRWMEI